MKDVAINTFREDYNSNVIDFNTGRPILQDRDDGSSGALLETHSLVGQTQNEYLTEYLSFLESDEKPLNLNSNSQQMFFTQIAQFTAQVPIPEFAIEADGNVSMIWYGRNGSFILALNGNLLQKEYSLLCRNGDSGYGILSELRDILFYINKIK